MIITALPSILCEPYIKLAAQFCLDVAFKSDAPSEIWILGGSGRPNKALEAQYPKTAIKYFRLDKATWPLDVGSNQILELPLTLWQAYGSEIQGQDVEKLYVPLHSACGYYLQMAKNGGLISQDFALVTTCFLPQTIEQPASLELPTAYTDVVTCEMEGICAQHSQEFWISHECIKPDIISQFSLSDDTCIKVLELGSSEMELKTDIATQRLVFCGPLNPVYGIDAFCDLAEVLDAQKKISDVIIFSNLQKSQWSKTVKARLKKLKATIAYRPRSDFEAYVKSDQAGVLICPMRAPVVPRSVNLALSHGMPTLWGRGFDLTLPSIEGNNLFCTVSDVRKLSQAWEALDGRRDTSSRMTRFQENPSPKMMPKGRSSGSVKPRQYTPIKSLSVILIHHNRLESLSQALKSLSDQTCKDFELIVIDDGSTVVSVDEIKSVINQAGFPQAQFHKIDNSYPSAARNHGALMAKGEALFFIDDDNVLAPRTLEDFFRAVQTHDIVQSFYQTFQGRAAPRIERPNASRPNQMGLCYGFAGLLPGAGLFFNILGNSSFMIRRDIFLSHEGFTPVYGVGLEDYSFLLKCSQQEGLSWVMLPEPYLHFRLHGDKIRNTHVDWRSPIRLQAGQWRLIQDLRQQSLRLSPICLSYARQLHELTQFHHIHTPRPKFFNVKSILLHQYIRPKLARHTGLRKMFRTFMGKESRLAKFIETFM